MSPRRLSDPTLRTVRSGVALLLTIGSRIREERRRRRWSLERLAAKAGVSRSTALAVEQGQRTYLDSLLTVTAAVGRELGMEISDPRQRKDRPTRTEDPVHAAMGELEAARIATHGFPVGVDEPYQHYQFSGRADVVAWRLDPPSLLHIENRTRFPNIGEVAGSWNAKRQWLGSELAERLGIRGFAAETHVMACLWSAEVLHDLRLRPATFRALAPHPADAFRGWWDGAPPNRGRTSQLVVLDPLAAGRQRPFIDLDTALTGARPRVRGYAEAADRLRRG